MLKKKWENGGAASQPIVRVLKRHQGETAAGLRSAELNKWKTAAGGKDGRRECYSALSTQIKVRRR